MRDSTFQQSRPWWEAGVIYQIYPRSFQDSDGDGVGDLEGIRRRLDHVTALGVDAIWISPIFLGICLTKRDVYCCFQSKISRILQEQGRPQLGKTWGRPRSRFATVSPSSSFSSSTSR